MAVALSTKFYKSGTAINNHLGINPDDVVSYDKLDIAAAAGRPASYSIVFTMRAPTAQGATGTLKFNYTTSALRNTAFTAWETALTQAGT